MRNGIHISSRISISIYNNFTSSKVNSNYNTNYLVTNFDLYAKYKESVKSKNIESNLNIDNRYKIRYYKTRQS